MTERRKMKTFRVNSSPRLESSSSRINGTYLLDEWNSPTSVHVHRYPVRVLHHDFQKYLPTICNNTISKTQPSATSALLLQKPRCAATLCAALRYNSKNLPWHSRMHADQSPPRLRSNQGNPVPPIRACSHQNPTIHSRRGASSRTNHSARGDAAVCRKGGFNYVICMSLDC